MNETLKKAIDTFGKDMQLTVAVEEFSELTKEICKHKRGADNLPHIIEEMADCYIMLEQMKMIFSLDDSVIVGAVKKKIERLKRMLADEQRKAVVNNA